MGGTYVALSAFAAGQITATPAAPGEVAAGEHGCLLVVVLVVKEQSFEILFWC